MENYEKSGRIFIAYKGEELSERDISNELKDVCPAGFTVKTCCRDEDNVVFSKIVSDSYISDRDPFWNSSDQTLSVSGYSQQELSRAVNNFSNYVVNDQDRYHELMNKLYKDVGTSMFDKLSEFMNFSTVIWNDRAKKMIAGVAGEGNRYSNLFYGYTKKNRELVFSNDRGVLENFCDNVKKMDADTYMQDGELFSLTGEKIIRDEGSLIKKSRENADSILEGLNALLVSVTKESVVAKIQANLEEYLASDDPKKRLTDYIVNELDGATQREVLRLIYKTINDYGVENNIEQTLRNVFDKILEDYTKTLNVPVSYNVYLNDTQVGETRGGFYHEKYPQILRQIQLDEPIMLIGPAGSGKNVAVSQVADSLGLKMYYTNNASNEFKLTGFIDAGGNYRDTEFYKAFKNGGVFFLDEIDNSDPSALIVINSALANGYMAFPHETIDRHPDFRIIAAANTWGKGADLQYVGRNALDAATLDRFDNIFFDYDKHLEECLFPNDEVLKFMWSFRDAVLKTKIPHVVSTRGIGKVYKKELNGLPVQDILTSNVVKNLGQDDVNTIIGNMSNINSSNKYFEGVKSLTLRR